MKVAVIGAGPAGLLCAWKLAEQNHEIFIFEKKTNLGAQGSGVVIQPVGLQVLDELGILDEIEPLGQRLNHLRGYTDSTHRKQIIAATYSLLLGRFNYSLGINRLALWTVLFNRVKALNVTMTTGVCITNTTSCSDSKADKIIISDVKDKEHGLFDLVIDSSGANSELRKYAKKTSCVEQLQYGSLYANLKLPENSAYNIDALTVYSGSDNQGVGIMPTGFCEAGKIKTVSMFFNLNLKDSSHINKVKGIQDWSNESFLAWKESITQKWPTIEHLMDQLTDSNQLYLAKFTHCTLAEPYGKRIVFIGDAAHCSSPQLGQGINMSLIDANILTQSFNTYNDIDEAIQSYAKTRKYHVKFYQTLAKWIAPFYQSDFQYAIEIRNQLFGFFTKMYVFRYLSSYLLSGYAACHLKNR